MERLGIVTYSGAPELMADDRLLFRPLQRLGFDAFPIVWNQTPPDSITADAIVIRSAWDYYLTPEEFLDWLSSLEGRGIRIFNHPSTIRWNMKKDYLLRLQSAGVPIPRTSLVSSWSDRFCDNFAGIPIVLKPVISASAHDTHLLRTWTSKDVKRLASDMLARGPILLQEYCAEVEAPGEWSFIFVGRKFCHALTKKAAHADFRVQEEHGGTLELRTPSKDLVTQAEAVLNAIPDEILYARVDGIVRDGLLILMELELFEPALYLSFNPSAAMEFASTLRQFVDKHDKF